MLMRLEKQEALQRAYPNILPSELVLEVPDAWFALVDRLCADLSALPEPPPVVMQVKESYGRLCFYAAHETPAQAELIRVAEEKSENV